MIGETVEDPGKSPIANRQSAISSLWIDTDIALGASRGNVDDGFALAAALEATRRGHVSLSGISTVFGNTTAAEAEACARRLCDVAGASVDIVRGASAAGEATPAADRIAGIGAEAAILALGPLTNIAAACRRDPVLPERAMLAVVGGSLSSRGFLSPLWPHEFNLTEDRDATGEVFRRRWKSLVLYPLDVVARPRITRHRLEELAAVSPLGGYVARGSERWLAQTRWRHLGRGFRVRDLPAALDAVGALGGRHERVKTPAALRRMTGCAELTCLVSFDPRAAWRRFLALLGRGP
ncbi:MAG TPA: nucleoside hydrolase [Thermoanaerobaculia bacterium]